MTISRRHFLAASAATGLLAATGAARAQAKAIRVGYIADYFGTSLTAIADDQKLWAKHGLNAETKVFTNGPIQIQALGAGSLDFGYIGPGALWLPASGKAKVIAMNVLGLSDRVIAQAGIKTMADLKGKKVGVPEGTSGDMLLRLALAKAGMKIGDIEAVKMDPSTVVSAFGSKQVAGAGIWYPLVAVIKQHVPDLVELAKNADFYPANSFPSAFVCRNEVAASDPDAVKKVIAVLKEANDYRITDIRRSVALTARFLGVPEGPLSTESQNGKYLSSGELVALTKDGTVARWLSGLNQQFASFGKLDNPLDPKDYYLGEMYVNS